MGIFKKIGNFISKPIRGIGRIARGVITMDGKKISQGIGDIGDTAKTAGKIVAPFNPVVGAVMTGVGGLAGKGNDPGGFEKWKPFHDSIAPAGLAYGGGKLAQHFMGGTPTAGTLASDPNAITKLGQPIVEHVPRQLGGIKGVLAKAGGLATGIGKFAVKNPVLALGIAGMGMDAYGAHQEGAILDQEMDSRARAWKEIMRRRAELGMA